VYSLPRFLHLGTLVQIILKQCTPFRRRVCAFPFSFLILMQLGKLVKKISKQCTHFLVKRAALDTLDVWKAVVAAEASSSPAPSSALSLPRTMREGGVEVREGERRRRGKESEKESEKDKEGKRKSSALESGATPETLKRDRGENWEQQEWGKG